MVKYKKILYGILIVFLFIVIITTIATILNHFRILPGHGSDWPQPFNSFNEAFSYWYFHILLFSVAIIFVYLLGLLGDYIFNHPRSFLCTNCNKMKIGYKNQRIVSCKRCGEPMIMLKGPYDN